jgi:hypothetical protein
MLVPRGSADETAPKFDDVEGHSMDGTWKVDPAWKGVTSADMLSRRCAVFLLETTAYF